MFMLSLILINSINNNHYDNVDCHLKFQEEMNKNLIIQNLTVQKLKEHLYISNYYLINTYQKSHKITDYSYLFNDICSINYDKIDYNDLNYRIKFSEMSKDKFIELYKQNKQIYEIFSNLFYYILFLTLIYLLNKYKIIRKIVVFYTVMIYIYNYIKTT